MYHEVTDEPARTGFQRQSARNWTLTEAAFARHLAVIGRAQQPTLVSRLDLHRPGRHVLLTFDDGGKSALHVAHELEQRGWLGHFFIVTGFIGERTFLNAEDIRRLRRAGHLVGSHSHTHPDIFRDLTRGQMLDEWKTSARILQDLLGEPCLAASVPGGDLSAAVIETAAESGFRLLFTSEPTIGVTRLGACWVLGRAQIKRKTSAEMVGELVRFRGWRRAMVERALKQLARRVMGPLYRRYVRRRARPLVGAGINARPA